MATLDDSRGEFLYRFRTGALEVDQARGEVRIAGDLIALEPKPLALLLALIEQPGQVLSRSELLQRLWGRDAHLSDNVLANAVMRLRRALGVELGPLVRNVAGQGYLLDAKVERVAAGRRFESQFELKAGEPVPGREAYLLDAPLGSSPHSEVWLARHAKTHDRRVFKFCSDGDRLAALKREFTLYRVLREALGERDDYARVLDANFSAPPFWLECEYGGESLLAWAAVPGRLAAMGPDERIALFLGAARAVADAHRVGVLHKDLKPANVLVAPAPAPAPGGEADAAGPAGAAGWITRITDFGSGRLLSPDVLQRLGVTQLGLTLTTAVSDSGSGTLLYLAPELFAGAVPTVQSDLYALGLMLYQLTVGDMRRPMATGWEQAVADELLREDIAAATQGRPEARLKSVAELVERLETRPLRREQRRQAVEQRQVVDAAQAEVRRIQARRPWLIALAVALAGGLGATTWAWRDAARQREAALQAGDRAQAVQAFLNDDVLGGANPFAAKTAQPQTVKDALLKAADHVDERFAAHPEVRGPVYQALASLLQTYQELGASNRAWAKALQDLRQVYGPADPRTVHAMYGAAMALSRAGSTCEAAALLSEADAAATPLLAADPVLAVTQAYAHGSQMINLSRPADAVPHMQRAVALAQRSPAVPVSLRDRCYEQLAGAYYVAGRYKEGIQLATEWIAALQARPEVPALLLAAARHRLGVLLANDGRTDEARTLIDQAVAAFETALGPTALETVLTRSDQCARFELAGAGDEAQRCREALIIATQNAPNLQPRITAGMRMNLGIGYFMMQRDEAALRWLDDAIEQLKAMPDSDGFQQVSHYYAACAEMRLGRVQAAAQRRGRLQEAVLMVAEPAAPWRQRLRLLHGVELARRGEMAQARELIAPALAALQASENERTEGVFGMAKAVMDGR